MKVRIYAPLFALILVFALSGSSSGKGQGPQWRGKIETVDGLKVVRNPNAPLYGDLKLDLKEDLQIGKEDVENYIFERILSVKAAEDGSIYVLDYKAGNIKKYDRNGVYLQTIGKKGQGPGEFQMPSNFFLHPKTRELYVEDSIHLKVFDRSGTYFNDILLKNFPSDFQIDDRGDVWAIVLLEKENGIYKALVKLNPKGEPLAVIAEFPYRPFQTQRSAALTVRVITGFEFDLHLAEFDYGSLLYGFSEKAEIMAIDTAGKALFKIAKDEVPQSFASDEVKGPAAASLPKHKPYFYSLFSDDTGRIYALKSNPMARSQSKPGMVFAYDVYGKDGVYLYKLGLPYDQALFIKNGYLYARHTIEDSGLEVIKRFKIGNWEKIRSSAN